MGKVDIISAVWIFILVVGAISQAVAIILGIRAANRELQRGEENWGRREVIKDEKGG